VDTYCSGLTSLNQNKVYIARFYPITIYSKRGGKKLREQDRHFLWSLLAAAGIIFVWKGLWEGLYEIPILGDPWVALFVGFAMLTLSGLIFKEFDPLGGLDKSVSKVITSVQNHPEKKDFHFKYKDNVTDKEVLIPAERVKEIEEGTLVLKHDQKEEEVFIPFHRITEILYKGNTYWRL